MMYRELKRIIDNHLVNIYLQPVVDIEKNLVVAYESLSRGPVNSPLFPAKALFTAAEEYGLHKELNILAFKRAIDVANTLGERQTVSINLDVSIVDEVVLSSLYELASTCNSNIVIEVTERRRAEIKGRSILKKLVDISSNIQLALDDMTLTTQVYELMTLPISIIKLDISIVQNYNKPQNEYFLRNLLERVNGHMVVAEGVENKEIMEALRSMGYRYMQGYYLGKPKPANTFIAER